MNGNSVPSIHKPIDYRVVQVWPVQTCAYCPRLTHVAILDDAFVPDFTPVCPLHGYAQDSNAEDSPEHAEARLASVCRFILWMHADTGTVSMTVPVSDLTSIPGYEAEELAEVEELAWHASYEPPEGERIHAYAVWSTEERQFYLYEHGALVCERREQVA